MPGRTDRRLFIFTLTAVVVAIVVATSAVSGAFGRSAAPAAGVRTGVVVVNTRLLGGGVAAGTGIVLTSSGEVLTNNHVIRGATAIRVTVPSTHRTYTATVAGYSVPKDVALLLLKNAHGLSTVSTGSSTSVRIGDRVSAVGNAGGTGVLTTKTGKIVALKRAITVSDDQGGSNRLNGLIESNAPLRPGDSGGPLLSGTKVIGIDAAASRDFVFHGGGDGFAIPIETAISVANSVDAGQASATVHIGPTALLGVLIRDVGQGATGALVTGVAPRSPAARAGLGAGDVIVTFAGHRVTSPTRLRSLVLAQTPGKVVKVTWIDRFTDSNSATVKLAAGPPQ
jgi:S1-C subfamily serine protease